MKLAGRALVWRDVRREGIVVHGASIEELFEELLSGHGGSADPHSS